MIKMKNKTALKYKKALCKFWRRLVTVPPIINYCMILTVFFCILYSFVLIDIPGSNWSYKLGVIINGLAISYMASYIFYFLNVHLENYRKKVNAFLFINNKLSKIFLLKDTIDEAFTYCVYSKTNKTNKIKAEELKDYCKKVHSMQSFVVNFPLGITICPTFKNWFEFLNFIHIEAKKNIDEIIKQNMWIDEGLIKILFDIDNLFERSLNVSKGMPIMLGNSPDSLEQLESEFKELYLQLSELYIYLDNNYKYVREEYHENYKKKS